eukprot:gene11209-18830_t
MVCTNPSAPAAEADTLPVLPLIAIMLTIAMRWLLKACKLPQYILSVNNAYRYFQAVYYIAFGLGYVQSDTVIHNKVMMPLVDVGMALVDGIFLQITAPQAVAFAPLKLALMFFAITAPQAVAFAPLKLALMFFAITAPQAVAFAPLKLALMFFAITAPQAVAFAPLKLALMFFAVTAIQGCNMAAVSHALEAQVSEIQECSSHGDLSAAQWFQIFGSTVASLVVTSGHEYLCRRAFLNKQTYSVEAPHSHTSSLYPRSVFGWFTEGSDAANEFLAAAPVAPSAVPSVSAASVVPSTMAARVIPSTTVVPSIMASPEEPNSRGGALVGGLRGGEILGLSQEGSCSPSQATVLPKQARNSSQNVKLRNTFSRFAANAEGGQSRKVVRKPSLSVRIGECFFGFADSAMEKHYVALQVQQMCTGIFVMCVGYCASSIYWLWKTEGFSQNLVGCILLEPGAPVGTAFTILAILMGRWRWMEPGVAIGAMLRFLSLALWMWSGPAFLPASTNRWAGPIGSTGSWLGFTFMTSVGNFAWHIRFKYGLLVALTWMAMVPSWVARSPTIVYSWPLQLSLTIATMLRLHKVASAGDIESAEAAISARLATNATTTRLRRLLFFHAKQLSVQGALKLHLPVLVLLRF